MVKGKPSLVSKNGNKLKSALNKGNPKGSKLKKQPAKSLKGKRRSRRKIKKDPVGVVYISHIPHGFYEEQIENYFSQFGKVTAVSVPRSKTGRVKGYAFIEYKYPEIAKIAADTMNNYLMFNRLLKAKYIPPEQQKPQLFKIAKEAREHHKTAADKAELALKHNRKLKNRHLKLGLEVKMAAKLLKKKNSLIRKAEKLGCSNDILVEEASLQSIFKRKKETDAQKNNKIKDGTEIGGEDTSEEELSSLESANDIESCDSDDSLSEINEENFLTESEEEDYKTIVSKAKKASRNILKTASKPSHIIKQNKSLIETPTTSNSMPEENGSLKEKRKKSLKNISNSSTFLSTENTKLHTPLMVESPKKSIPSKKSKNSLNKNMEPLVGKTPSSNKKKKNPQFRHKKKESNSSQMVMEVDSNDKEIHFKTPNS